MAQAPGQKKNILVLGGAGFIGSHLCDALIRDNHIICVDNFVSGSQRNIDHLLRHENFIFLNVDITQLVDLNLYKELDRFDVKFNGVQEIYNFACPTSPKDFQDKIVDTALANSVGTANGLNLAVKYNAKFLHFSSSVVYGKHGEVRVMNEDTYFASDPT